LQEKPPSGAACSNPGKAAWGGLQLKARRKLMTHALDILPICDIIDSDWDAQDVRDLVQTTPLCFDDIGVPASYLAGQLFGLEGVSSRRPLLVSGPSLR